MASLTFDTHWWSKERRRPAVGHWEGKAYAVGSEWVIGQWQAVGMFKRWIEFINILVEGERYKQHWKHSYFGYMLTQESQTRGVVHFHVIIDNYFPWAQASKWWWEKCGSINITKIEDLGSSLAYCLKYCLKTGYLPVVWTPNKRWRGDFLSFQDIDKRYQEYMQQPFEAPGEG
jgi:hypothetical protein